MPTDMTLDTTMVIKMGTQLAMSAPRPTLRQLITLMDLMMVKPLGSLKAITQATLLARRRLLLK